MDHKNPVSDTGDGVLYFGYPDEIRNLHWLQILARNHRFQDK
jgi:hypothetical protein